MRPGRRSLAVVTWLVAACASVLWCAWELRHPLGLIPGGPWDVDSRAAPGLAPSKAPAVSKAPSSKAAYRHRFTPAKARGKSLHAPQSILIPGQDAQSGFGHTAASAGDVNGDGYDDLVVGAFNGGNQRGGVAYVFFGGPTGVHNVPDWRYEWPEPGAGFGVQVEGVGDVNHDGYADILVGASSLRSGYGQSGFVALFLGGPSGPVPEPRWTARGNTPGDRFGLSLGAAGDVNGDGYDDVLVGAWSQSRGGDGGKGPATGQVHLYAGGPDGLSAAPVWTAAGEMEHSQFGACVHGAGDLNGDGFADVVVGSDAFHAAERNVGRTYVYYGAPDWPATEPSWTATGALFNQKMGGASFPAGDVDGDGIDDLVLGVERTDHPEVHEGAVLCFLGSPRGLARRPSWVFEPDAAGFSLGRDVFSAGDVNGDGFADIIASSVYATQERCAEGMALVFHGSSHGPTAAPNWTQHAEIAGEGFGTVARCAGDLNGDGYSDVVLGSELYGGAKVQQGAVRVFYGGLTGLGNSSQWRKRVVVDWYRLLGGILALAATAQGILLLDDLRRRRLARLRERAQAEERERISTRLRDQLGDELAAIQSFSRDLQARHPLEQDMVADLAEIECNAGRLSENLTEIVWLAKASNETLENLLVFLDGMVQAMVSRAGLTPDVPPSAPAPERTIPYDLRHDLILAVKEAVHNALKHASASRIRFERTIIDGTLVLTVQDDGKGFDPGGLPRRGNGLTHMQSRIRKHGGQVDLAPSPKGTVVRIRILF